MDQSSQVNSFSSGGSFTISGVIYNLQQSGLTVNNGGDQLAVAANSMTFTMPSSVPSGEMYNLTLTTPASFFCAVLNGSGTISNGNITNVIVNCGTFSGQTPAVAQHLAFCTACHGINGVSMNLANHPSGQLIYPFLAAQQTTYVQNEINDFISGSRAVDISATTNDTDAATMVRYMKANLGSSSPNSMTVISALAIYFSSQAPAGPGFDNSDFLSLAASLGKTPSVANGQALFNNGSGSVPACVSCHQAGAVGSGGIPRLSGQVATRILDAFTDFEAGGARASAASMPGIVGNLSEQNRVDLAAYLNSL